MLSGSDSLAATSAPPAVVSAPLSLMPSVAAGSSAVVGAASTSGGGLGSVSVVPPTAPTKAPAPGSEPTASRGKRRKGGSHHQHGSASSSSAAALPVPQLSQSDVAFFQSLSEVGELEETALSLLSPSDRHVFKAVRDHRANEIHDGRLSVHVAGVDGVWPVTGGTIGGMTVPPRPETVRVHVRVHGVSSLGTPVLDASRRMTATVRLVTNDASLAPEWALPAVRTGATTVADGASKPSPISPLSMSPASVGSDHAADHVVGSPGASATPLSGGRRNSGSASVATSLPASRPPRESGMQLSTTATLLVKSAVDEVSITVLDSSTGALLGQHTVPVMQLVQLSEREVRVPLGVSSAPPPPPLDKPYRAASHGAYRSHGASGSERRSVTTDDGDDDSEGRHEAPVMIVTLLALNFSHRRAEFLYEPVFSGSELNAPVLIEGLLDRRCGRRWRERYVRLDEENLYIFKAADDRERPEVLPLALASVKETTSSSADKKSTHAYRFEIWNSNHDRHEFCTNSVQAIKRWMAALEGVCSALLSRKLDQAKHPLAPSGERTILDCVLLEARDLGSGDGSLSPSGGSGASSFAGAPPPTPASAASASGKAEPALTKSQPRAVDAKRSFSTSGDVEPVAPPSSSSAPRSTSAILRSPLRARSTLEVYALITVCGQQCRTGSAASANPQWSRGDGSESDWTLGTSVNCSFVLPSERSPRSVVRIELFDEQTNASFGFTQIALADVQTDVARWHDGAVWLPLAGGAASSGVVRVRLQLNSRHSGMLAHYGYPLATMPLRAHSGDLVLFTPDSAGARVVRLMTSCKWTHVAMVVMGHNDKLKLLEATAAGVTLRLLDAQLLAYHRAGSVVGVRRLCGVARTAAFVDSLIEFVDRVEGTPYETKYTQMLKAQKRTNKEVDLDAVFCSELVAAALMHIGVLSPREMLASNFLPKDFAAELAFVTSADSTPSLARVVECRESGSCAYVAASGSSAAERRLVSPLASPGRDDSDDSAKTPRSSGGAAAPGAPLTTSSSANAAGDSDRSVRMPTFQSDTALLQSASGKARKILLQGSLSVKMSRNRWRTRWLKLTSDHLFVFKTSAARSTALEVFPLTFASVKETTASKGARYEFELFSGLRHEVFSTDNVQVLKQWTSRIQACCDKLLQAQLERLEVSKAADPAASVVARGDGDDASNSGSSSDDENAEDLSDHETASSSGDEDASSSGSASSSSSSSSSSSGSASSSSSSSHRAATAVATAGDSRAASTLEPPSRARQAQRRLVAAGGSADDGDDSASPATTSVRPMRHGSGLLLSTGGYDSARSSEKFPSGSSERAGERFPSMTSLFNEGSSTDSADGASVEARIMRAHREEIRKSSALLDAELKLLDVTINNKKPTTTYLSELDALLQAKLQSVEELRTLLTRLK